MYGDEVVHSMPSFNSCIRSMVRRQSDNVECYRHALSRYHYPYDLKPPDTLRLVYCNGPLQKIWDGVIS